MATTAQRKRQRLIQMAEGYLDLTTVFEERWPLEQIHREKMAERTIDCLNRIEKPKGHRPYILFLKGQAHRISGRFEEAIGFFRQSFQLDPDNLHTLLAVAWCYKRVGQLQAAIDSMRLAIDIDPDSAIAHYNLACYLALDEDVNNSVIHLSTALDLNPKYRQLVDREPDFDCIRANPDFQACITVNA
jgi:tetratricopeptide (TPR) repeat protein